MKRRIVDFWIGVHNTNIDCLPVLWWCSRNWRNFSATRHNMYGVGLDQLNILQLYHTPFIPLARCNTYEIPFRFSWKYIGSAWLKKLSRNLLLDSFSSKLLHIHDCNACDGRLPQHEPTNWKDRSWEGASPQSQHDHSFVSKETVHTKCQCTKLTRRSQYLKRIIFSIVNNAYQGRKWTYMIETRMLDPSWTIPHQ